MQVVLANGQKFVFVNVLSVVERKKECDVILDPTDGRMSRICTWLYRLTPLLPHISLPPKP